MVETEDHNMKAMINVFINIMKKVFSLSKCKSKFNSRISRGDTLDVLIRKLDNLNVKNHDIIDQVVNYYAKVIALRIKFAEEEGMLYLPVVSSSINNEISGEC